MEIVAEVVRSGFVESRHRGMVVQVDPSGAVVWAVGDPETVLFPRSSNKPLQAMGLLRAGLALDGRLLAIATSSHSGELVHIDAVREVLALAGLDESALQTPAVYPGDSFEHARVLRAGGGRAAIQMDCSGKHAAMLLTCVQQGWPVETYLDPQHPVQQAVTQAFVDLTGSDPAVVGVDGCGAPLLATSLVRLAGAIGRIARASDEPARRLVSAMTSHPELVSGVRRTELRLMQAIPGSIAKSGAEGVLVVGMPDGSAWAAKIEDGNDRALYSVMGRALELAGHHAPVLAERPEVFGGGRSVGRIDVAF